MVNLGPSNGCHTCKQRRIKCDEGKPICQRCILSRRPCGGYKKKPMSIRFKNGATKLNSKLPSKEEPIAALVVSSEAPIPALRPVERDVAMSFFINSFARVGRNFRSAHGFFEALAPVVSNELPSSAISLAVTAVATRMHTLWRDGAILSSTSGCLLQTFGFALNRLQQALKDEEEAKNPATVLAALVLQFYEKLAAAWGRRQPNDTHHHGAIALFMHQGIDRPSTAFNPHIVASILQNEVTSAMGEQRPVPPHFISWIESESILLNPSSMLNLMGISVANLQHRFLHTMQQGTSDWMFPESLDTLQMEVESVNQYLLEWPGTLPSNWHPIRLQPVKKETPPIITYNSDICDIYLSVHIASFWNTWRCYRLMLLQMAMILRHINPSLTSITETTACHNSGATLHAVQCIKEIQELVDAICDSIAFHLGNCSRRSTLHDATDPNIAHPSYHSLPVDYQKFLEYLNSDHYLSLNDHRRHVIALGPWHAISPLGYLVGSISTKYGGLFEKSLRPGQSEWVQEQLNRAFRVIDLEPPVVSQTGTNILAPIREI